MADVRALLLRLTAEEWSRADMAVLPIARTGILLTVEERDALLAELDSLRGEVARLHNVIDRTYCLVCLGSTFGLRDDARMIGE